MKRNARCYLLCTFWLLLGLITGCSNPADRLLLINGRTMGTTFSVKIVADDGKQVADTTLESSINGLLVAVNMQMSTYIPDSELSKFNRSPDTGWVAVSTDFARVMQRSLEMAAETGGALDITVGPLVNLWGFGPEQRPLTIPAEDELRERLVLVGFNKISVRENPPAIKKAIAAMYCDLSATAKGFGVDKIAEFLDSKGYNNYFVEIGGETRTSGQNEHGQPWRIGIASPGESGQVQQVIHLIRHAVATSGDYFNYYEIDGRRYSHTIDPRTGKPITHNLASVTVVSKDCLTADGMATALDVMGPEKGMRFALEQDMAVYMILREKGQFVEKMTPAFEALLTGK